MNKIWTQINNDWKDVKSSGLMSDTEENSVLYANLIKKTLYLISYVGDYSNLSLDPNKDGFYLGYSISVEIPLLIQRISIAREILSGINGKKIISEKEKTDLVIQKVLIKNSLDYIKQNTLKAISTDKILKERTERFIDDLDISVNNFLFLIDEKIAGINKIPSSDLYSAGDAVLDSSYRFYETEISNLEYLLNERINKLNRIKFMIIASASFVLLFIMYIFVCFNYSLLRSLKSMQAAAESVSLGNFDKQAEIYSEEDEMGSLSASFNYMISNLGKFMDRELVLREIILRSLESHNTNEIIHNIVNNTERFSMRTDALSLIMILKQ